MKRIVWLLSVLTLSLILVACGGNAADAPVSESQPAESESESADNEAMEEEAMEEEAEEMPTIVDIAVEDGRFNTLVAAVTAAGLAETLSGEGPYTVFAPTDEAFAALPEGTVDSLLEDPAGALTDILLYHVVQGAVPAETVVTLDSATTLQGEDVSISLEGDSVVLNESVNVVTTDIEGSNGIIHVIDAVLLPPSMSAEAQSDEEMMDGQSIAEIAAADGRFTTLLTAVEAAGLAETLSSEGTYTVFAPTDEAFAALPEGTVEALLADPQGALSDVLLYHVLGSVVPAADVVTYDSAVTLQGEQIAIAVEGDQVVLNDSANVIITDIEASNGIIHVIDAVILPPSMSAADQETMDGQSIAEIAAADGNFTTLVAALEAAGLAETLSGEGEFTVFAPTDDAFAALPEGTVEALLEDPAGDLTDILLYHVVEGAVPAETVVTLDTATTLQGEDVTIEVTDDGVILNDSVMVTMTDIMASNGIIHVIDGVLLPPSMGAEGQEQGMSEGEMTIAEIAAGDENFSTLVTALDAAGLVEVLADEEAEFTVFAPTNDAFAALPEGTVEALLEDPEGDLTDILLYHVVEGAVPAETVVTLDAAMTVQGSEVTIEVTDEGVILNDSVMVTMTDIMASNGIIHVIDGVLLPPEGETSQIQKPAYLNLITMPQAQHDKSCAEGQSA